MTKTLISIVGPTAIGKTALSIKLAQHFKTEILSADSRQFYREMSIGTAAPTPNELQTATHHFIHHKSVHDIYTVGDFEKEALQVLNQLFQNKDIAILVGGSGLYVDAVINGLDEFPEVDPSIRDTLNTTLQTEGLEALQKQLQELDPKSYATIAIDNPHRVIRALEVSIGNKKPYSSFLTATKKQRFFKTLSIGLSAERDIIYNRINKRVNLMVQEGLLDEVKRLYQFQGLNTLNTVGYKELFRHLNGDCTFDDAISEIKKNTRRFAKRQLTWFKKNPDTIWFDYETPYEEIIKNLKEHL